MFVPLVPTASKPGPTIVFSWLDEGAGVAHARVTDDVGRDQVTEGLRLLRDSGWAGHFRVSGTDGAPRAIQMVVDLVGADAGDLMQWLSGAGVTVIGLGVIGSMGIEEVSRIAAACPALQFVRQVLPSRFGMRPSPYPRRLPTDCPVLWHTNALEVVDVDTDCDGPPVWCAPRNEEDVRILPRRTTMGHWMPPHHWLPSCTGRSGRVADWFSRVRAARALTEHLSHRATRTLLAGPPGGRDMRDFVRSIRESFGWYDPDATERCLSEACLAYARATQRDLCIAWYFAAAADAAYARRGEGHERTRECFCMAASEVSDSPPKDEPVGMDHPLWPHVAAALEGTEAPAPPPAPRPNLEGRCVVHCSSPQGPVLDAPADVFACESKVVRDMIEMCPAPPDGRWDVAPPFDDLPQASLAALQWAMQADAARRGDFTVGALCGGIAVAHFLCMPRAERMLLAKLAEAALRAR